MGELFNDARERAIEFFKSNDKKYFKKVNATSISVIQIKFNEDDICFERSWSDERCGDGCEYGLELHPINLDSISNTIYQMRLSLTYSPSNIQKNWVEISKEEYKIFTSMIKEQDALRKKIKKTWKAFGKSK